MFSVFSVSSVVKLPFKDSSSSERPVTSVPWGITLVLLLALGAQIGWHLRLPAPIATARDLPVPPPVWVLRALSLGEEPAFARLLMLWLQAFDHQPGISIPFRNLDYDRVAGWLERILVLDPRSRYPLLSAVRIYAEVPDPGRRRKMIDLVERQFPLSPPHSRPIPHPTLRQRWCARRDSPTRAAG